MVKQDFGSHCSNTNIPIQDPATAPEQDNGDKGTVKTLSATVKSKDHDESKSVTGGTDSGKRKRKDPEILANETCKKRKVSVDYVVTI